MRCPASAVFKPDLRLKTHFFLHPPGFEPYVQVAATRRYRQCVSALDSAKAREFHLREPAPSEAEIEALAAYYALFLPI